MTQLSDTQLLILSAAAQRTDRLALPLPNSLRGRAVHKAITPLIEHGLLSEISANHKLGDPVWRENSTGDRITLIITDAGLAVIGVEADGADSAPVVTDEKARAQPATVTLPEAKALPRTRTPRENTKQATLIAMLRAPEGATIAEIMAATGWQSHTVRGALAGSLKKKLGLEVSACKSESRGRVYRLPAD